MDKKINVGVLFGGKSAEHEISIQSAKNVIDALDKEKYTPVLIGIDKTGKWHLEDRSRFLLETNRSKLPAINPNSDVVTLVPQSNGALSNPIHPDHETKIDVVFPVLHGPFGEDGTVQGFLKLANIPFVGAGVLGSALGMDKDAMKRLLREAKIPVAKFLVFHEHDRIRYDAIAKRLRLPFFVKPANLGSSVGITKVHRKSEFDAAVRAAFQYDRKILVEEHIKGRELECAVLGNEDPIASVPGEIIPSHEFYSYEAKYLDENGAELIVPANVSKKVASQIQSLAIQTFKTLSCEGLARVDCFLTHRGKVLVNEINTMPGFTAISMYPRLWKASGINYSELIDRLIQLAFERFKKEQKLKTSYR